MRKVGGCELQEACVEHIYAEAHDVFEAICAGGSSPQPEYRSAGMPDGERKVYRHWSMQVEAADADRIEAAAKAVHESRSLFVRKAALARAAEVEAGRERRDD